MLSLREAVSYDEEPSPVVDAMYDLARASYPEAQARIDAADRRLQELLIFGSTLTVAAVTISANARLPFASPWFLLAITTYILGVVTGVYGRLVTRIRVVDVAAIWNTFQDYGHGEFKRNFIKRAAEAQDFNHETVLWKWSLSVIAGACFLAETGCLITWAVSAAL
jgi:hypothetical protein